MFATIGTMVFNTVDVSAPSQIDEAIGLFAVLIVLGIVVKVLPDRLSDIWK